MSTPMFRLNRDDLALAKVLEVASDYKPDVIVGLGGGSVMDITKLVSVLWDGSQHPDISRVAEYR